MPFKWLTMCNSQYILACNWIWIEVKLHSYVFCLYSSNRHLLQCLLNTFLQPCQSCIFCVKLLLGTTGGLLLWSNYSKRNLLVTQICRALLAVLWFDKNWSAQQDMVKLGALCSVDRFYILYTVMLKEEIARVNWSDEKANSNNWYNSSGLRWSSSSYGSSSQRHHAHSTFFTYLK